MATVSSSRTPPGVRELKLSPLLEDMLMRGRTPPGVRELKLKMRDEAFGTDSVAPLPGCVN